MQRISNAVCSQLANDMQLLTHLASDTILSVAGYWHLCFKATAAAVRDGHAEVCKWLHWGKKQLQVEQ
jgi:hypothetical protein